MFSKAFEGARNILVGWLVLGCLSVATWPAAAANYPLELVLPRAAGTAPASGNAAVDGGHRIFKAYPGLEYNIKAVVIGGAYPYRFSLSGAPAGMTIDEDSGLIRWADPRQDASPTITVVDSEGARVSSSWRISVTTSGFHFVDAVAGRRHPTGTGSIDNPWRTISDMVNSRSTRGGDVVYFRTGTYDALDLPRTSVGGVWERVEFSSEVATSWLAYPGADPVIDFGYRPGVEPGVIFRFGGANTYLDGFEARNARVIGIQLVSEPRGHYRVLRNLDMHDLNVDGGSLDGSNASFIMTTSAYTSSDSDAGGSPSTWSQYLTIQDSRFSNVPNQVSIKIYSQWKLLIEGCLFRDVYDGIALKADIPRFTVRGNRLERITRNGIAGNLHSRTTSGEMLFNLFIGRPDQLATDINQDAMAKRIDVYRNTFLGRVRVRYVDSQDGPFRFYRNVIVNDDRGDPIGSHVYREGIEDPSRVEVFENLGGYPQDGIVNAQGILAPEYARYIGTHGHQVGEAAPAPSPPGNLVVQ